MATGSAAAPQHSALHVQSATVAPLTWFTRVRGNRERDFTRQALLNFDAHDRRDRRDLFAEADRRSDARAKAQRHFGAPIVGLALPRKRQRLIGAAERGPSAFRADSDRSLTNPPVTVRSTPPLGSESVALDTGAEDDGRVIDSVPEAAATGSEISSDSTDRPVRESTTCDGGPSIKRNGCRRGAHHARESCGDRHFHPALAQHIDGEQYAASVSPLPSASTRSS